MIYKVEITETLQRIVSIDAANKDAAILTVKQLYRDEDIVLDSSDYISTAIDIFPLE